MQSSLELLNEVARLETLHRLRLLDTVPENEFDEIVSLATQICDAPAGVFSLIDQDRQWFKSCLGLEVKESHRDISFCSHAIQQPDIPLIINDARKDERFKNNPLVTGKPNIVFYAGFPVIHRGFPMGTLCVVDYQPRTLSDLQVKAMKSFAQNIGHILHLRAEKNHFEDENTLLSKVLSLNSSFYLLIDQQLKIREIGTNFIKSIPEIQKGDNFLQHFKWHSTFKLETFLQSGKESYGKLVMMDAAAYPQRYKCSISCFNGNLIICASPVINAQFGIQNYQLKTKDFAPHDSILEYLFLQETTTRNIKEAKEINEKITSKSIELEKLIQQLQQKEKELILSNIRIEEQRQFYSEILNNFPTDIAVFSTDHRYLFVNRHGIKDEATRKYMIGRTDYDYCDLKKLDYSMADQRKAVFNKVIADGTTFEWEDTYTLADNSTQHILRKLAPVKNDQGEVITIIGYGTDITEIRKYQILIETQNDEIKKINDNLEKIVVEKTQKNNELTQLLSNQDKFAMVGEITAGITHDLNTPLGAIKVGSESLAFTLEDLFNTRLATCTQKQLQFACKRANDNTYNLFIGGMQTKKEINSHLNFLATNHPELSDIHPKLAEALVKARIGVEEKNIMAYILQQSNQLAFLELIYSVKAVRFFIATILAASEKASAVIKNLRFYLKEGSATEMSQVNLSNSIQTVLSIFSHEIKKGVEIEMDVPEELYLFGYEAKIYQLWSNIIKNAIDAMNSKGIILIRAHENEDRITIHISNNGPQIPEDIRDKIFDKFFTTKESSQGTGLGLNIVRQVMDEHRGQVSVVSDKDLTTFIFNFPKKSKTV
ncbi:MAG: GHKL domain-containing protein [Bacteroidetes bacterium]|nr:GHKL domain-containing protein [Bacteroidota bacterium]